MTTSNNLITDRVSLTTLRKATKQIQKLTKRATSINVELWKFESGVEKEIIKVFVCSSFGISSDVISKSFSSMEKLNNFINELKGIT